MQPIHRKTTIVCPRCKGLQVNVPWDIHGTTARKRFWQVLFSLWGSFVLWILLWLLIENFLVLFLPFIVYAVVTSGLLSDYFLNLSRFSCAGCGFNWKGNARKR